MFSCKRMVWFHAFVSEAMETSESYPGLTVESWIETTNCCFSWRDEMDERQTKSIVNVWSDHRFHIFSWFAQAFQTYTMALCHCKNWECWKHTGLMDSHPPSTTQISRFYFYTFSRFMGSSLFGMEEYNAAVSKAGRVCVVTLCCHSWQIFSESVDRRSFFQVILFLFEEPRHEQSCFWQRWFAVFAHIIIFLIS